MGWFPRLYGKEKTGSVSYDELKVQIRNFQVRWQIRSCICTSGWIEDIADRRITQAAVLFFKMVLLTPLLTDRGCFLYTPAKVCKWTLSVLQQVGCKVTPLIRVTARKLLQEQQRNSRERIQTVNKNLRQMPGDKLSPPPFSKHKLCRVLSGMLWDLT